VSWWQAEGDATDAIDANHGVLVGGAGFAPGLVGQAFTFDGIDDYIDVPDSASLDAITSEITVEAWLKPTGGGWFFARRDPFISEGFSLGVDADGSLSVTVRTTTSPTVSGSVFITPPSQVTLGVFHHVAVTASTVSGQVRAYVDGQQVALANIFGPGVLTGSLFNVNHLFIGRRQSSSTSEGVAGGAHYEGLVDEISLYSSELSQSEIEAIYDADTAGKCLDNDTDADGLLDEDELAIATDPNDPDTDGDGLTDGDEVLTYLTDPLAADTDGDGLTDGDEIAIQAFGCPDPLIADTDNDGLLDGDEIDFGLDPCNDADADGDGLMDSQEVLDYGTDPNNPDTDGDGLFDGTEVDIAQGSGCPSPTNPDSDGDTILDGAEADLGTNPCSADTDGDGVPDNEDDLPTEPGVTSGFLEDAVRAVCDEIDALPLDVFEAPNNNARKGRRNALCNGLQATAKKIAQGELQQSLDKLYNSLLPKLDGEPSPDDWMVDGPDKDIVRDELLLLAALIELELQ
jgi:hypothetical protein